MSNIKIYGKFFPSTLLIQISFTNSEPLKITKIVHKKFKIHFRHI